MTVNIRNPCYFPTFFSTCCQQEKKKPWQQIIKETFEKLILCLMAKTNCLHLSPWKKQAIYQPEN
jgi:hypothetical protein